jgi:hypothetical protein
MVAARSQFVNAPDCFGRSWVRQGRPVAPPTGADGVMWQEGRRERAGELQAKLAGVGYRVPLPDAEGAAWP